MLPIFFELNSLLQSLSSHKFRDRFCCNIDGLASLGVNALPRFSLFCLKGPETDDRNFILTLQSIADPKNPRIFLP